VLLQPYAPHFTEELYATLEPGKALPVGKGLMGESYPVFDERFVKESTKKYPVAINGKTRQELELSLDATAEQVDELVRQDAVVLKWMEGRPIKKVIYVPGKMINVVG
jgi:leucyl-tRNA synthetase